MSDFCLIWIASIHRSFKNCKILIFKVIEILPNFLIKKIVNRFEHVPWKNVWFCFMSIFWVNFSHKNVKFRFSMSMKYFFFFFWQKRRKKKFDVGFEYVLSSSDWFGLIWFKRRCLRGILALSWSIRILKFIEIV